MTRLAAWIAAAALLWPLLLRAASPECPQPQAEPTQAEQRALAARAIDRGLLWKLTKDGRSSWLFGTMHLGRAAWAHPGPALRSAWRNSDVLALELDLSDPATQAQLAAAMLARTGPPLPPALAGQLRERIARSCLSPGVERLHPVMQLALLEVDVARRDGLEPQYAQEHMLARLAERDRRSVVGLETVDEQLQALLPDDPAAVQADVESALSELDDLRGPALMHRLTTDWAEGRLEDLERFPQWCDCARTAEEQAALARLNDDRNPHLADGITALHDQGRRVLAAVGALHMTGPNALPRLLAARGFRVERVTRRHR